DAISLACCVQVVPPAGRTNTYAAPGSGFAPPPMNRPTTAVSPQIATEPPSWSLVRPSDAVSFACCVQIVPPGVRTNTYAEPWSMLAPMSSPLAPTTTVSRPIATEVPKKSFAAPSDAVIDASRIQPVPDQW